jgi:hypothetical protein
VAVSASIRSARRGPAPGPRRGSRGAAGDPLGLQPAAALEDLVVGVVEVLGVLADLLGGEARERDPALNRLADEAADDAVGLAEGDAAADQQVGDLGRRQHLIA